MCSVHGQRHVRAQIVCLKCHAVHVQLYVKAVTPVVPISSPGAPGELLNVPDWPGSWRGLTDKCLRMRTHAEINS